MQRNALALAKHSHCPVAIIRTNDELPQENLIVAVVDRYPDGDDVKLVVTDSADAGMLTRLVGPHGHALATYPNCSVLLVRYDDQN